MSPSTADETHQELRLKLQQQRQRIQHLLAPPGFAEDAFPRSMTMRLLTRHPTPTLRLASQLALLLLSPRLVRTLSGALLLSRLLYALTANRRPPS